MLAAKIMKDRIVDVGHRRIRSYLGAAQGLAGMMVAAASREIARVDATNLSHSAYVLVAVSLANIREVSNLETPNNEAEGLFERCM